MACEYICDGCGTRKPATHNGRDYCNPAGWYQHGDKDGIQDACSRACIDRAAAARGKTFVVLPV